MIKISFAIAAALGMTASSTSLQPQAPTPQPQSPVLLQQTIKTVELQPQNSNLQTTIGGWELQ